MAHAPGSQMFVEICIRILVPVIDRGEPITSTTGRSYIDIGSYSVERVRSANDATGNAKNEGQAPEYVDT